MEDFDPKSKPLLLPEAFDLNIDPLPAIDFNMKPMEKINRALLEASELDFEPVKKAVVAEGDLDEDSMGITTIGVTFDGGVVFGVDSKLQGTAAKKIFQISDNIYLCCNGSAADCQMFLDYVRCVLSKYTLRVQATVKATANLVRSIAYTNKSTIKVIILGGWDKYEGGKVYLIPQGGSTLVDQPFAGEGPMTEYMCRVLEGDWKQNMTEHEAEMLVVNTMHKAINENAASFNGIQTIVINSGGPSQKVYPTIEDIENLNSTSTLLINTESVSNATRSIFAVGSEGVEKNSCLTPTEAAALVINKGEVSDATRTIVAIDSEQVSDNITIHPSEVLKRHVTVCQRKSYSGCGLEDIN